MTKFKKLTCSPEILLESVNVGCYKLRWGVFETGFVGYGPAKYTDV